VGALVGLGFGLGALLIVLATTGSPSTPHRSGGGLRDRTEELLSQAGLPSVGPSRLFASCAAAAFVAFLVAAGISRAVVIGAAFAVLAGYVPVALVKLRRRQRRTELREVWPDVVDNLASGVRAGLSLPEAVSQLASRGPDVLRPAFESFAEDYRATGRFGECLDRLKAELADPVADRIAESLRVARDVGGSDLGRLLRTLSQFLRDDARTRAELEARQSWTVNAARLGVAAPWVVLALLSLRPQTVAAYDTASGAGVLVVGGVVSVVAYRLMLRIARLPVEQRVLR
jgi:tight adherence protein B